MAHIIKTTGEVVEIQPKNGTDFQLEELQAIVGGYIEIVNLRNGKLICCDEEGKLKGYERNNVATDFMRTIFRTSDFLVGDVLVCDDNQIK